MTLISNTTTRFTLKAVIALVLAGIAYRLIDGMVDFPTYYLAGRSLLKGETDLYAPQFSGGILMDYRYPPFFVIVFSPIALLPYKVATYLWFLLSFTKIYLCWTVVRGALRLTPDRHSQPRKLASVVWLVTLLTVAQYFVKAINFGNVHLLVVLLMFASLYFAMQRCNLTAALLMSVAITFKLTPLLLLPYFALKRRWKFLIYTSAFLVLFNLFLPAAFFGFKANLELLRTWHRHVVIDSEFHELNGPINLSLKGQLRRYFTEVHYEDRYRDQNYKSVNIANLSTKQTDSWWMILIVLTFTISLGIIWCSSVARGQGGEDETQDERTTNERNGETLMRTLLEHGLMICLMLLVGPSTSKIYFVALLWPVTFLAYFAFQYSEIKRKFIGCSLVLIASINIIAPLLPGSEIQRLLLVVGVDFYVTLFLLVLHGYALILIRGKMLPSGYAPRGGQ